MNPRVMIVEDERIVALDLKGGLENMGYNVVGIASRGLDAIADAHRLRPDIILMDINLEGAMDGTEAAQQIHDQTRLPVIFLSAYSEEQTLVRAEASSPYGYLLKPFEPRELRATLRMALARRKAEVGVERAEERLRLAVDAATLGVWEWEAHEDSFYSSGHMERIMGCEPKFFREGIDNFLGLIHSDDRAGIAASIEAHTPVNGTVRTILAGGRTGWIDVHAKVYADAEGDMTRVIGVISDVTERRKTEEKLRQASVVFQGTAEGILILDEQRLVVSINAAFTTLTGFTAAQVIGRDPDDFLHARRHSDQFFPRLEKSENDFWHGEIACMRANGERFPAWQHVSGVRGEDNRISQYVVTFTDISAIRLAEQQINHLAYHDALTGLGNRHLLNEKLKQELDNANANGQRVALIFIDLDRFKLINDTLGHAAGDQLLQVVAQRIREALRRSDIAIRMGGDEFVIIVPDVKRVADCATLSAKLLERIRGGIDLPRDRISISASVGIAFYPDNAINCSDLIKAADSAMYGAKACGRNRYAFYSPDMAANAHERMLIEQGLVRALEECSLVLHYQPVVSLNDSVMVGLEALVRWQHPELGLIQPGRFIPVAEETGLIDAVGDWVMRQACTQGAAWLKAGHEPLRLAVNVSVRQMAAEDFVTRVGKILDETGFPPEWLEIEITESTLQTIEHSQGLLYRLRALGVSISIDDFGTGFSSLGLLKHLPIDRIKIDRSFVTDLPDDVNDAAITRAIVAMAQSMDIAITAEGVETVAQRNFLRDLGCEDAQGFLFSTPITAAELSTMLEVGISKLSNS